MVLEIKFVRAKGESSRYSTAAKDPSCSLWVTSELRHELPPVWELSHKEGFLQFHLAWKQYSLARNQSSPR